MIKKQDTKKFYCGRVAILREVKDSKPILFVSKFVRNHFKLTI